MTKVFVAEDLLVVGNLSLQLFIFGMEFLLLNVGELCETHIDDGFRLQFVQREAVHQSFNRRLRIFGGANDVNDFVNVVGGNDESFKDMCSFLCFAQVELGASNDDVVAVFHEVLDTVLQGEEFRTTVNQSDAIDCK